MKALEEKYLEGLSELFPSITPMTNGTLWGQSDLYGLFH